VSIKFNMDLNPQKSLPADNLYKFIAIFGLALFVTAFFIPDSYNKKMWQYRNEVMSEMKFREESITGSINSADKYIKNISEITEKCYKDLAGGENKYFVQVYNEKMQFCNDQQKKTIEFFDDYISTLEEVKNEGGEYYEDAFSKMDQSSQRYKKESELLTKICLIAGFFLMLFGFIAWYFRTQRYLDWILRERGEKFIRKNMFEVCEDKFFEWLRKKINRKK